MNDATIEGGKSIQMFGMGNIISFVVLLVTEASLFKNKLVVINTI